MNTTIAATATAQGRGAIAVIRVSGPKSSEAYMALTKKNELPDPNNIKPGWVYDGNEKIDHSMLVYFQSPHSFTGEDMLEIHCHGSNIVQQNILQVLFRIGIDPAKPGEFSERAYYNGKIDIAQAEAIMELVSSENTQLARLATRQLAGEFSAKIKSILEKVTKLSSAIAADLDFSEEDLPSLSKADMKNKIKEIIEDISNIKLNSEILPRLKSGINVALIGLPNAGKSTLMNALLGYERSIVTSTAGTTRDAVSETVELGGMTYQFIDTAGLNTSPGKIEKIGIEKSIENIKSADIILLLIEPNKDKETMDFIKNNKLEEYIESDKTVLVHTKSDIRKNTEGISISAKNNKGIKELIGKISKIGKSNVASSLQVLTERQLNILNYCEIGLIDIQDKLDSITLDIIGAELESVISNLNELTGEHANKQIIDSIFRNFCIGK
jgi:tRNA modification GTPase